MEVTQVCAMLALLADIPESEALVYSGLAQLAIDRTRAALRAGVEEAVNADTLNMLCAAQANAQLALLCAGREGGVSLRVGEVTLAGKGTEQALAARALRDELFALSSALLADTDFVFEGVEA